MTFPGFSEPTEQPVLSNVSDQTLDTPGFLRNQIAERDQRISELRQGSEELGNQIAERDNRIVSLSNAVNTLRDSAKAEDEAGLRDVIENAVDHIASSTVSFESDSEGITVRIEGVILDSMGELVAPVRDWLVEGTLTIPVSFVVRAANESEAEDLGVDALRTISYSADDDIQPPFDHDVTDFGCGQADYDLDGISEN